MIHKRIKIWFALVFAFSTSNIVSRLPEKFRDRARDPGRYPEQTDDVATAIRAARNPAPTSVAFGRVNGKVGAVGGSAGASHAAYCAAAPTLGGDQLDAAVLLSGASDFHDPASLIDTRCATFGEDVRNYVGCSPGPACDGNGGLLDLASPYRRFTGSSSPVFIVASNLDPMPPNQFTILVNKVAAVGVPNCRTPSYNTKAGAKRMHWAFLRVMAECERSGDCVFQYVVTVFNSKCTSRRVTIAQHKLSVPENTKTDRSFRPALAGINQSVLNYETLFTSSGNSRHQNL